MDVLETIARMQRERRSARITPDHVPETELMRALHGEAKEEIRELCRAGKAGWRKTVNGAAFFIPEEADDPPPTETGKEWEKKHF